MAQVAIIIGNGFDLDLGLKTRYSDFMKSPEFEEIYQNKRMKFGSYSLLEYLKMREDLENWFDMEIAIHDYVVEHNSIETKLVDGIKEEFESLKEALCKYLNSISDNFKKQNRTVKDTLKNIQAQDHIPSAEEEIKRRCEAHTEWLKSRCPVKILDILDSSIITTVEIYFNYTNPRIYLNGHDVYLKNNHKFIYVHGSLDDNNIVLGCDLQPGEKVNRNLSFMYKYNMLKQANHIARDLMEATEIIFYGHSVNEMDFCYFSEFFKAASASPSKRNLTFITFDEKSERDIKDNIRNQGISVSDLYSNLDTVEFIHTSKIYNKEEAEIKKWDNMCERLKVKQIIDSNFKDRDLLIVYHFYILPKITNDVVLKHIDINNLDEIQIKNLIWWGLSADYFELYDNRIDAVTILSFVTEENYPIVINWFEKKLKHDFYSYDKLLSLSQKIYSIINQETMKTIIQLCVQHFVDNNDCSILDCIKLDNSFYSNLHDGLLKLDDHNRIIAFNYLIDIFSQKEKKLTMEQYEVFRDNIMKDKNNSLIKLFKDDWQFILKKIRNYCIETKKASE